MADDVEPSGRGRAFSWVAILVVGLPLLYVLSVGPVIKILDMTHPLGSHVSWELVMSFYAPLEWLYEHTFLRAPLDLYLHLWGIK